MRIAALALLLLAGPPVVADPPATGAPAETNPPAPSGSFFSSLKQAFKQDLDKEVVRAHFDLGAAPDTRRYYCLVDAKTGKREENGVTGQPIKGPDGMTRITSGAVSLYGCADADRQGILISTGYALTGAAKTAEAMPAAPTVGVNKPAVADDASHSEILAVFGRFVAGHNAHDRAAVAATLSESAEFVLAETTGGSLRSRDRALDALADDWQRNGPLEPLLQEAQVSVLAPDAALLILPVTQSPTGAAAVRIRWAGIFVKARAGWRIGSILLTPPGIAP